MYNFIVFAFLNDQYCNNLFECERFFIKIAANIRNSDRFGYLIIKTSYT